jgi:signal transduction histidine kinase/ligand-binding sensor domain-containing protein/CheY-like chemotaxis protein
MSLRPAGAAPPDTSIQRLPIIDKHDIRFIPLSVGGEPFRKRVLSLAQDNYGFVWLGTDDGLFRYDGYTLRAYRHDPANPGSLSENSVLVLYKDRSGVMWIGTSYGGLDRFDPAQNSFTHYRHDPANNQSLNDDHIFSIYQDSADSLWVGTNNGFDRLDMTSGHFVHYLQPFGGKAGSYPIWGLYEDGQKNLLVGCGLGLYKLDRSSGRLARSPNSPVPSSDLDDPVEWFPRDRSGAPWFTLPSENIFGSVNARSGELRRYAFGTPGPPAAHQTKVSRVLEDRNGVLWIGTVRDGLLKFDKNGKYLSRYNMRSDRQVPGQIWTLLEDSEGNVWAGGESGVTRFQPTPPVFVNYQHEPDNPDSLRDNKVLAVHPDAQGVIWIGTERGLQALTQSTGRISRYQNDPGDSATLSHNAVSGIQEDGSGGLWVGTHGGGLNRLDRASGRFIAYRHNSKDPRSLSSDVIIGLLADPGGELWVATDGGGLNRFDPATGHSAAYRHDYRNGGSLSSDVVRTIFIDRTGVLWVGTNQGLDRFDRKTGRFSVYLHDERNPRSVGNEGINSIYEDRQGSLWIGTRAGLNRLDPASGSFERFTTRNGFADDYIEAIREDNAGNLWLATHAGLSEFRPGTRAVRNYSEADGLLGDFAAPTGTERSGVTPDGVLVFGSDYGLTLFDPVRVSTNQVAPPVVLTDFLLFNVPVVPSGDSPLKQRIWATRAIVLNHAQSIFTLEFAALSYIAPDRNRYRYRLEPLEKDWNEVGANRRVATYTSLAPGKYVFRVQGSNNDLFWSETGTRLDITVLPPWWGTWWFRAFALLSITSLAFTAYRWRVGALHLAAHRLELKVAERTRELQIARDAADAANRAKSVFLANMSHELRTPLNAILGFSRLLRDAEVSGSQRKDLDIINRSGEHLLNLINNVLDLAKVESGRTELHIEPCDVKQLMADIMDMMRVRAREKDLALCLVDSPNFPRVVRTDPGKLRQVLINLVSNAIKFTAKGSVTLHLSSRTAPDGLRILLMFEVEDTGIGIPPEEQARVFDAFVQAGEQRSQKGTGLGLTISRQFVELMGGSIQLASTPGSGTRFRVELPADLAEQSQVAAQETEARTIIAVEPARPDFRVLVVDDKEENRLVLQRLMEMNGFQVRLAANGERAVDIYQSWRPDLIWMDLRMPVMDGREAVRRIRALDGGLTVKIAAVTASAFNSEREELLAAGVDDFVRKPYQASEIFDCMARHLDLTRIYSNSPHRLPVPPLGKEDLEGLPGELLGELADAVVTLDDMRIREVIAEISVLDSNAGAKLGHLAERFVYTSILDAVDGVRTNGGPAN